SSSSRDAEQASQIDITGEVVRQRVEDPLNLRLIAEPAGTGAKPGQQRGPLAIIREQPMHIGGADTAVGRYRAVRPSIGEAEQRPIAVGALGLPDMHLVTAKRCSAVNRGTADLRQRL